LATLEILKANLLSPIVLAFVLGIVTKLLRSEFALPKDLYTSLSIYLLLALGQKAESSCRKARFGLLRFLHWRQ
jgi:hypothetical protein